MTVLDKLLSLEWSAIWVWSKFWLVFLSTFAGLYILRNFTWSRLQTFFTRNSLPWGTDLLRAAESPIRIGVFCFALIFGLHYAPESFQSKLALASGSKILVVILGLWALDRVLVVFVKYQRIYPRLSLSGRSLLLTIFRVLLISLGVLILLDTLGVAITPVLASLGVGSVAVALALQETLTNLFSGIYLLIDQPIRIGDFVKIDEGMEGFVRKIGWRSTHIQVLSNNTIIIPNSNLSNSRVNNYNLPDSETAVLINIGISYQNDLDKVEKVTIEVATEIMKTIPGCVSTFSPFIRYNDFTESAVKFTVILRAKQFIDNYLIKHEFLKSLHARYRHEGITFGYPQRVVQLGSPTASTSTPSTLMREPIVQ